MSNSDQSYIDSEEEIQEQENNPELIKTNEIVEDSDSDSEDDVPISQRRTKLNSTTSSISDVTLTNDKVNLPSSSSSDSDSDQPLSQRMSANNSSQKILDPKKRKIKTESNTTVTNESSSDSEDDVALSKRRKTTPLKKVKKEIKTEIKKEIKKEIKTEETKKTSKRTRVKKEEEEKPSKRKKTTAKVKEEKVSKRKKKEEEEVEVFRWWDNEKEDDSVKWTTLEHQGPYFPPEYVSHGIKMKYKGEPIDLVPECEEVANFYAQVIGTDWGENPTFRKNFFKDFLKVIKKKQPDCPIKKFEDCDFTPLTEYFAEQKEKRKAMTKEEKEVIKKEKLQIEDKYGWALLDGRKEKVGNFRIEPPGLFRGRGEHPKTGTLKHRVYPESVTINIGENAKIPEPPEGHKWGKIIHDNTVTWLAMWKENVNDSFKYVWLAAGSSLKGQSDFKKFEKARELKKHIGKIRAEYTLELKDKLMATRQRATALYFIDKLALRAGNEKGDDVADTVGCCSLRYEHVTLEPPNRVIFDFLGKDSIRYYNEVEVSKQVYKNIEIFKRPPKKEGDMLFDRLNTTILNKYLQKSMKGLTAKVFRTYNASYTFQEELKKTVKNSTINEKLLAYNRANRQVAILCNHQRAVSKNHSDQLKRIQDKILTSKYQRYLVSKEILELDPTLKKKKPELGRLSRGITKEFIKNYEEKELEKKKAKLERDNEKRKAEGKELLTLEDVEKSKRQPTMERLEKQYDTLSKRIKAQQLLLIDKDENKTTALGTSKINYIDPRISAAWCYKYNVPIEKIFNKSLRNKFKWAVEVDENFVF
jgi:DNA topoisomerase-1